ncbi:hypothetical protein [Halobacterium yunchengense]|uniref:hypothetical protein n=1 Tax=Halobacterium yunchengense TaxID=3108497 RepID=UPI00300B0192
MSRRLVPVAVAALLVVAGCTGLPGESTPTASPETVDPAEADLPPGVSERGVTNASALAAAHDATLRAEGFVLEGTFERDPPSGAKQTRNYTTVVAPGGERFRTAVTTVYEGSDEPDASGARRMQTRAWSNGSVTLRAVTIHGETAVSTVADLSTSLSVTRAPQLRSYLEVGAYDVERVVVRDDHAFTTLVAEHASGAVGEDVSFDARLVVDERGVVHEADVAVSGPDGVRDDARYEVVRFGGSPERPEWVEDAEVDG